MRQVEIISRLSILFTHTLSYATYNVKLTFHVGMQVTELKPEWLVEIAPHYYQMKDVEDGINLSSFTSVSLYYMPSEDFPIVPLCSNMIFSFY